MVGQIAVQPDYGQQLEENTYGKQVAGNVMDLVHRNGRVGEIVSKGSVDLNIDQTGTHDHVLRINHLENEKQTLYRPHRRTPLWN